MLNLNSSAVAMQTRQGEHSLRQVRASVTPTVGRQVLRSLVTAVERTRGSREEFLRAARLTDVDLDLDDARGPRLTASDVSRYCEQALLVCKDPALGLHWGERLESWAFGPVFQLFTNAESLRDGFALLHRYGLLFHDEKSFELVEPGDGLPMSIRMTRVDPCANEVGMLVAEATLSGLLATVRASHANAEPIAVNFAYAAPAHGSEYTRVFGTTVRFEQPHTELVFDHALLDRRSFRNDPDVQRALQLIAEQRLLWLTKRIPWGLRLRDALLERAPERPAMPEAARLLGLSARSLRRHLSTEGTSFREVERAVLTTVVRKLLCERRLTIKEAAYEMGFGTTAAFHRAFRIWTGTTPKEFAQERWLEPVRDA